MKEFRLGSLVDRKNKYLNGVGLEEHSLSGWEKENTPQGSLSRGIRMEKEV